MPNYYVYLISSLPMLHFATKPVLSLKGFLNSCVELLNQPELELIHRAISTDAYAINISYSGALLKWKEFDTALRNELARARAIRKKISVEKFLRPTSQSDMNITHIAQAAIRKPSILESEKFLDLERWKVLDEISSGHYFDLDFLLVYALKLVILERWEKINFCDKTGIIEKVLSN